MRYSIEELMIRTKRAVVNFDMINDDSGIMVGLSGGKDSITLLFALKKFHAVSKYKYRLAAGHIGLGFEGEDVSPLEEYCKSIDVPFFYEKTDIGKIVFEVRKEPNPCSLCAKLRRGALNSLAKNNGYDKIALGHHQDDVVETLLLKTFFEGNLASFNPVTYLERKDVTVIRPLIYSPEKLVGYAARKNNLPVIENPCPANGQTNRQRVKDLISQLETFAPKAKDHAIGALEKLHGASWDGKSDNKDREL